jgi:NMD protein affecting ribosome stability and mRNA decay
MSVTDVVVRFPQGWGTTKQCTVCGQLRETFSRGLCVHCFRDARDRGKDLKKFGTPNIENERSLPRRSPWEYENAAGEQQLMAQNASEKGK